jgi:hypothetical protein
MGDVLEVRLQRKTGSDFVLVNRRDERFVAPDGPGRTVHLLEICIKRLGPWRDARIASGETKFIFRSTFAETDEFDPRIGINVDDVAVRRAVGCPREDSYSPIVIMADPIYLLLEHGIDAEIAGQVD